MTSPNTSGSNQFDDHYYVVLNDLGWGSPRFAYGPTTSQRAAIEFKALTEAPTDNIAPTVTFVLPQYLDHEAFEDVRPIDDLKPDYQTFLEQVASRGTVED